MSVSVYSIAISVIFFNLFVVLVVFLSRRIEFLVKYSVGVLFLLAGLSLVRLITPLDHAYSLVIPSDYLLPHLIAFLNMPLKGTFVVYHLLLIVWLGGSLAFLFHYLLQSRQEIKRLKGFRSVVHLQAEALMHRLYPKAKLTVSPDIEVPQVSGICKPHIYLPVLNLSDDELAWVLKHELKHFRNRDLLIKILYLLLVAIFWWNPLLRRFRIDLDNLLEFRCDASLMSYASELDVFTYFHAIIKVMKQAYYRCKRSPLYASALFKYEPKKFIYQRIDAVSKQSINQSALKIFCGFVAALFFLSYFVIIQPAYEAPDTEEYLEFTPQNSYIIPTGNERYNVYYEESLIDCISKKDLKQIPFSTMPMKNTEE